MNAKLPISGHPITYVRTVQQDGSAHSDGFVFCTRRAEMVATTTCAHCPRMVKITTEPGQDLLHCSAALEGESALDEQQVPLTLPRVAVSAIMTRNVVCVRPDLTLDAATALFLESGLRSAPVVDQEGKLIGFVSESEVLLDIHTHSDNGARTVGDVMLPYALTLPETATVTRAAAVMAFEGQPRLAIVSRQGAVVGVLSASDIMYWLARADGHLLPRPRAR